MTHFGPAVIDSSLTGGFLTQPITEPTGTGLFGTSTAFITSTGAIIPESDRITSVLDSLQDSTNRILEGLKNSFLQVTQRNILGLADISSVQTSALNELITLREQDIAKINEAFGNIGIAQDVIEEGRPSTLDEVKDTLSQQLDSLAGVLGVSTGTAAVIIGGIALLIVVKR